MQTMCGKKLNMKWKDTYTAEISANSELVSQSTNISDTEPDTVPETTAVRAVYVTSELALCSMVIESWDFQDRIMFYFKDVQFVAKCSEAMLEVFDGPSSKYSLVSGKRNPLLFTEIDFLH